MKRLARNFMLQSRLSSGEYTALDMISRQLGINHCETMRHLIRVEAERRGFPSLGNLGGNYGGTNSD